MNNRDTDLIPCQYCGEYIENDATRCKYCAGTFSDKIQNSTDKDRRVLYASAYTTSANKTPPTFEAREKLPGKTVGNGLKVLLAVIFSVIPLLGQIIGAITAIVLINSSEEKCDRRSFGAALLIACIVMFVIFSGLFFVGVQVYDFYRDVLNF